MWTTVTAPVYTPILASIGYCSGRPLGVTSAFPSHFGEVLAGYAITGERMSL